MKHFFTGLILFFSIITFGQVKKDPTVTKYIGEQKEFVRLSDLNKVHGSIKPYLNTIKDYMANNEMDINGYWIWTSYVQENSNSIFIPICHYDGFVFKKNLEEKNEEAKKNRKAGDLETVITFNGNASGKDGNMEIDKTTNKVLSFALWQ